MGGHDAAESVRSRIAGAQMPGFNPSGGYRPGASPAHIPFPETSAPRTLNYRGMFPEARVPSPSEIRTLGDFCGQIYSRQHHPDVWNLQHGEYSDPHGGFLLPSEMSSRIVETPVEGELILPRATVFPMRADELTIPRFDDYDRSSGLLFGGVQTYWGAEGDTVTETRAKWEQLKLVAGKLWARSRASNELLADVPMMRQRFESVFIKAIRYQMESDFLTGTGGGKPTGILNDPALVTISKQTGQAAGSILYQNLTQMYSRLYPGGRRRAVWLVNDQTAFVQLAELVLPIGTGGSWIPIMREGADGQNRILGLPVLMTELLPAAGTKGDILLCDVSQYAVGMRSAVRVGMSEHFHFDTDETAIRALVRVAGEGMWRTAMTPTNGDTKSWCVAIEDRT